MIKKGDKYYQVKSLYYYYYHWVQITETSVEKYDKKHNKYYSVIINFVHSNSINYKLSLDFLSRGERGEGLNGLLVVFRGDWWAPATEANPAEPSGERRERES